MTEQEIEKKIEAEFEKYFQEASRDMGGFLGNGHYPMAKTVFTAAALPLHKKIAHEQARTLRYKELLYSQTEQGKEIERLEKENKELREALKWSLSLMDDRHLDDNRFLVSQTRAKFNLDKDAK